MVRHAFIPTLLLALAYQLLTSPVEAASPSETLLPETTKGFLSIPDLDDFRAAFDRTQLGQLVQDPVMKPFVEDLQRQLQNKFNKTNVRLGIHWEDLADTYGGEIAFAIIQPRDSHQPHAIAIIVDITGHRRQARQLLDKISKKLLANGATRSKELIDGLETVRFAIPDKDDDTIIHHAYYRIHENYLIATDHRQVQQQVYGQLQGTKKDSLAQVEAFQRSTQECRQVAGDIQPHIRWFVDPFGYAQVIRDATRSRRNSHKKMLGILSNQGFGAVQGLGGWVTFDNGEHEITHHTWVHAPADRSGVKARLAAEEKQADSGKKIDPRIATKPTDKYTQAARMLQFPNTPQSETQTWVPSDIASYMTLNWKVKEAFEYSKSLVNEMLDAEPGEDLFEEILDGIAHDVNGPQVDFRNDLVAFFGQRICLISDHTSPITPDSERWLFAIEVTDTKAVAKAIEKLMKAEPDKKQRIFQQQVIWELIQTEEEVDVDDIQISGAGFDTFGSEEEEEVEQDSSRMLAKWAITVNKNGILMIASSAEYIIHVLKSPSGKGLESSTDFQRVSESLKKMGATSTCLRLFTRTDRAYHTSYELLRRGKMPESKSLFGIILNRLLSPEDEGAVREQEIDGSKMPPFELVAKYLGPSGGFMVTEEDGWFLSGCLLAKPAP